MVNGALPQAPEYTSALHSKSLQSGWVTYFQEETDDELWMTSKQRYRLQLNIGRYGHFMIILAKMIDSQYYPDDLHIF